MSRLLRRVDAPPVPERELTVRSADGARIHVEVHGPQDAPTVVLAHGWTCSTRFWDAQIRALSPDHRVVAYDQRGHGGSPAAAPGGYSTDALADDLEAVLAATLGPGRKAVIAGHSMGGMTVMAAARRDGLREHAAAVLLCSTGSSRLPDASTVLPLPAGKARTAGTRAILAAAAPLGPVTPITRRVLKYATMGAGAPPERVALCARIVHACPRAARSAWGKVLADLDLDAGVRELRVPTAVVAGTADRLTPIGHAHAIAAALPDGLGLTELTGLGHMTPVEAPEAVTEKIRELAAAYLPAGIPGTDTGKNTSGTSGTGATKSADGTDGTDEKEEVA
ncbi:alpha/beta fold hydrolase [Streptomyces sp. NPDC001108]